MYPRHTAGASVFFLNKFLLFFVSAKNTSLRGLISYEDRLFCYYFCGLLCVGLEYLLKFSSLTVQSHFIALCVPSLF